MKYISLGKFRLFVVYSVVFSMLLGTFAPAIPVLANEIPTSTAPSSGTSSLLTNGRDQVHQQLEDKGVFNSSDFNGSFSYSYGMSFPEGRLGMTPGLTLDYNNFNSNDQSIVGYGWNLGGISYIEKISKQGRDFLYAYENRSFQVNSPFFSGELISLDPTIFGKYQLKIMSEEAEFEFQKNTWTIQAIDGKKYTFGGSSDFLEEGIPYNEGELKTSKWYLQKIEDLNGNTIDYSYFKDENNVYLDKISYGGNSRTSLDNFIHVKLSYFDRDDTHESYAKGYRVGFNKLLQKIELVIDGENNEAAQKIYEFSYVKGDNAVRNILEKITHKALGSNGVWSERVEASFEYHDSQISWTNAESEVPASFVFGPHNTRGYGVDWTDINGDGLTDFVYSFKYFKQEAGGSVTEYLESATYLRKKEGDFELSEEYKLNVPLAAYKRVVNDHFYYPRSGVKFLDINADGLVDLYVPYQNVFESGAGISEYPFYLNTGNGFEASNVWKKPPLQYGILDFANSSSGGNFYVKDETIGLVDYNQDGFIDFYQSGGSYRETDDSNDLFIGGSIAIYLNNREGEWEYFKNVSNQPLSADGFPTGRQLADVNRDGLLDIVAGTDWVDLNHLQDPIKAYRKVFINQGNDYFVEDDQWSLPEPLRLFPDSYESGTRLFDINHDGITDIIRNGGDGCWDKVENKIYLGTGNGFVEKAGITLPYDFSFQPGCTEGFTGGPLNTPQSSWIQGMTNSRANDIFLYRYPESNVAGQPYVPNTLIKDTSTIHTDYLRKISLYTKKEIEVTYKESSDDYTNDEGETRLPYVYYVVNEIKERDGVGGERVYKQNYFDGFEYRDENDPLENQSAGFRKVKSTSADGTYEIKFFHQGFGARDYAALGGTDEDITKKGRLFRKERYSNLGELMMTQVIDWDVVDKGNGSKQVIKKSENKTIYNDDGSFVSTAVGYEYDVLGRLSKEIQYGEVEGEVLFTDVGEDKKIKEFLYADFVEGNASSFVSEVLLKDFSQEIVSHTKNYYDSHLVNQVSLGNLTKNEVFLKEENRFIAVSRNSYNDLGLQTVKTDALGNQYSLIYDAKFLYPVLKTNPLGHTEESTTHLLTSKVLSQKNANGYEVFYRYDGFNRLLEVRATNPKDAGEIKLIEAIYEDNSTPVRAIMREYQNENDFKEEVIYFDGFSQVVQIKVKKGEGQYITQHKKYDHLGRLEEQSYPFVDVGFEYNFFINPLNGVEKYIYDGMGRVTQVIKPNGIIETVHQSFEKQITDEKGNRKDQKLDAFGNLVLLREYNENEVYETSYDYDALNQLIKITDANENEREFVYDSLGRMAKQLELHKKEVISPHEINYVYNDLGNLIEKTDAENVTVSYEYDALNRVVKEENSLNEEDILYTYDVGDFSLGKITRIDLENAFSRYEYDIAGNTKLIEKGIDDRSFTETFDLDFQGRVLEKNLADGTKAMFDYDERGLLEALSYDNGEESKSLVSDLTYNETGLLTHQKNFNYTELNKIYDNENLFRLLSHKVSAPNWEAVEEEAPALSFSLEDCCITNTYNDDFEEEQNAWQPMYNSRPNWEIVPYGQLKVLKYNALENTNELTNYEHRFTVEAQDGVKLVGRVQENGDTYFIRHWTYNGNSFVVFQKYIDGEYVNVSQIYNALPITYGAWYSVALRFEDNEVFYKIWEENQTEPTDWNYSFVDQENSLSQGKPGFGSYGNSAYFKETEVLEKSINNDYVSIFSTDFSDQAASLSTFEIGNYSNGYWINTANKELRLGSEFNGHEVIYNLQNNEVYGDYEQSVAMYGNSGGPGYENVLAGRVNDHEMYVVKFKRYQYYSSIYTKGQIWKYTKVNENWNKTLLNEKIIYIPYSAYSKYVAKLKFQGNTISYKFWNFHQSSEPSVWTSYTDQNNPILNGGIGLGASNGGQDRYYDLQVLSSNIFTPEENQKYFTDDYTEELALWETVHVDYPQNYNYPASLSLSGGVLDVSGEHEEVVFMMKEDHQMFDYETRGLVRGPNNGELVTIGRVSENAYYKVVANANASEITLEKVVKENNVWNASLIESVNEDLNFLNAKKYYVRLQFVGEEIKFKVWEETQAEPFWQLNVVDENTSLLKGHHGVYSETSNTKYDRLELISLNENTEVLDLSNVYKDDFTTSTLSSFSVNYSEGSAPSLPVVNTDYSRLNLHHQYGQSVFSINSGELLKNYSVTQSWLSSNSYENGPYPKYWTVGRIGSDGFYVAESQNNLHKLYKYKRANNEWELLAEVNNYYAGSDGYYSLGNKTKLAFVDNKIVYKKWKGVAEPKETLIEFVDNDHPILEGYAGVGVSKSWLSIDFFEIEKFVEDELVITPENLPEEQKDILAYEYLYDAVGNITHIADTVRTEFIDYSYDDLYRLKTAEMVDSNESEIYNRSYNYDAIGNILHKSDVGDYQYNDALNPTAVTSVGGVNLSYDSNGNLLTKNVKTLAWNARNELIALTKPEVAMAFSYDQGGNRYKKTVTTEDENGDQETKETLYISKHYRVLPDGNTEKEFTAGEVTILVKENSEGEEELTVLHKDHLGSSSITSDDLGVVVTDESYYPYGGTRELEGNAETRQFTGQIKDEESELYYYNARYYDPAIGRFVSFDPLAKRNVMAFVGDTQQGNGYAYTANNPVMYTDPSGEAICGGVCVTGMIMAITFMTTMGPIIPALFDNPEATVRNSPIVGDVIDGMEATSGRELFSGETLTPGERALTAGMMASPLGGKAAREAAKKIAGGHAFKKHVIKNGEFKGIAETKEQYQAHIESIMEKPTDVRSLERGRTGYWDEETGTVVIHDPKASDAGTAFQPDPNIHGYTSNREYFEKGLE